MPLPSRLMIRFSFLYLIVGFLLGASLLIHKAYPLFPGVWHLIVLHIEMLIFGWIIQFTLGTAYWILPKSRGKPADRDQHWAMIIPAALNLGIFINIGDHLFRISEHAWLVGRFFELVAVVFFIALHWNRVKSFMTR